MMRAPARDVRTRAPGGARSRRPRDAVWWWCMGLGLWFVCRCVGERVLCGLLLVCVGARVFVCLCVCFCSRCVFCPLCGSCVFLSLGVFFGFGFVVFSCVVSCVLMDFRLPS